jgi:hypothetical protein
VIVPVTADRSTVTSLAARPQLTRPKSTPTTSPFRTANDTLPPIRMSTSHRSLAH